MKTIDQMAEEAGLRSDNGGLFYRSGGIDGVTAEDLAAFAAVARAEPARTLPAKFVDRGLALAKGALYCGRPFDDLSRDELIAVAAQALAAGHPSQPRAPTANSLLSAEPWSGQR